MRYWKGRTKEHKGDEEWSFESRRPATNVLLRKGNVLCQDWNSKGTRKEKGP